MFVRNGFNDRSVSLTDIKQLNTLDSPFELGLRLIAIFNVHYANASTLTCRGQNVHPKPLSTISVLERKPLN